MARQWFEHHYAELKSRSAAQFNHLPFHNREEAVADVLATAYLGIVSAADRGVLHRITPFHLIDYARRQHRTGRRFGGSSTTDVLAEGTALCGRVKLVSLDDPAPVPHRQRVAGKSIRGCGTLAETLADRRQAGPAEQARQNLDYHHILIREKVGRKARRVFQLLASVQGLGSNSLIASALNVSAGRVCQIKNSLAAALSRHGYTPEMRPPTHQGRRRPTGRKRAVTAPSRCAA